MRRGAAAREHRQAGHHLLHLVAFGMDRHLRAGDGLVVGPDDAAFHSDRMHQFHRALNDVPPRAEGKFHKPVRRVVDRNFRLARGDGYRKVRHTEDTGIHRSARPRGS